MVALMTIVIIASIHELGEQALTQLFQKVASSL